MGPKMLCHSRGYFSAWPGDGGRQRGYLGGGPGGIRLGEMPGQTETEAAGVEEIADGQLDASH